MISYETEGSVHEVGREREESEAKLQHPMLFCEMSGLL